MIDAIDLETLDTSNRIVWEEKGEKIKKMKTQQVSGLGAKEKYPKMIIILRTCLSQNEPKQV